MPRSRSSLCFSGSVVAADVLSSIGVAVNAYLLNYVLTREKKMRMFKDRREYIKYFQLPLLSFICINNCCIKG